jgi:hypothetical protein
MATAPEVDERADLAELAGAMMRTRARARREPGTRFVLPAGYQRRVGWRVMEDGTERVLVQREHLRPWEIDREGVEENLPPGLRLVRWETPPEGKVPWRHAIVAVLAPLGAPDPNAEPTDDA